MRFAVVMRKQAIDNPWVSHRWTPVEVFADSGQFEESGVAITTANPLGRFVERDTEGETWLFRGFELDLFPDEAEGLFKFHSSRALLVCHVATGRRLSALFGTR